MTFEVYRRLTVSGWRWFWRLRARNHRIVAVGGESFHNKSDVLATIDRMVNEVSGAQVKVL